MKKSISFVTVLLLLAMFALPAVAAEIKIVGTVTRIEVAADGKAASVTVRNGKTDKDVILTITDQETLDKFAVKKIVEGDEVRVKYDDAGGKNMSRMFKKSAGC